MINPKRRAVRKCCSYCGTVFTYVGSHGTRNKHFFCSHECYIAFKTKKAEVKCDWCGKSMLKKRSDIWRTDHNFCCPECCLLYRQKQGETSWNHRVNGITVHRGILEKKLGRELRADEEVHHIDGNHFNNDPDNLIALSKSEHAKIHSSWKARDEYGKYVKTQSDS